MVAPEPRQLGVGLTAGSCRTAGQWNYDEVPGGASAAWTSDGAC